MRSNSSASPSWRGARALIQKRNPKTEVEIIETGWAAGGSARGVDYVAIQNDGSEYPYKIEEWKRNMEEVEGKPGYFRKKVPSKLIKVPDGVVVECVTIDGGEQKPLEIESPDFVCIGGTNERSDPLARSRFNDEFEWID